MLNLLQTASIKSTNQERFSLFKLRVVNGEIKTVNRSDFKLNDYSKFKYGDAKHTKIMADKLARELINRFGQNISDINIAASPYKNVPTAASNLMLETVVRLAKLGYVPKGVCKIDRGVVKAVDYSTLTAEERRKSNSGRGVSVSEATKKQIDRGSLIIIDDIRISGHTEQQTRKALLRSDVKKVYYAYISEINDDNNVSSDIEHRITHSHIKDLKDLRLLIESSDNYYINARTCKFILRGSVKEVKDFASSISDYLYSQILHSIIADGYHTMPEHKPAFSAFIGVKTLSGDNK